MKALSITFRALAIIGAGIAIFGWVKTNGRLTEKQQLLQSTQAEIQRIRTELSSIRDDVVKCSSQIRAKTLDLADERAEVKRLRSQYAKLRRELEEKEQDFSQKNEAIAGLQTENETLKDELVECNTAPEILPAVIEQYENQITALKKQLADLKLAEVKAEASIPDSSAKSINSLQGITAKILSISIEEGLLVLDVGEETGLEEVTGVYLQAEGLHPIQINIAAVYPGYSVAYVLPGQDDINQIEKGETVILTQ